MPDILKWLETAKEYEPLIKTGIAAASTYAAYKDQKKKNEMQRAAYDDYMAQVAAAGQEARAAIDINYSTMTVSGVPTSKADVTDFTAVAAQGGLMSIPNKQRKRYARGPNEFEVEEMASDSPLQLRGRSENGRSRSQWKDASAVWSEAQVRIHSGRIRRRTHARRFLQDRCERSLQCDWRSRWMASLG